MHRAASNRLSLLKTYYRLNKLPVDVLLDSDTVTDPGDFLLNAGVSSSKATGYAAYHRSVPAISQGN